MRHRHAPMRALPFVAIVSALVAVGPEARAACTSSANFGQLTASCGGSYCYVVSPGDATVDSLVGAFWSFGSGAPAPGAGNDNGGWTGSSWLLPGTGGRWMSGDWNASSAIDGCIVGSVAPGKPAEIMVGLFGDQGNGTSYFAAASARRVVGAYPEFDFTFAGGGGAPSDIVLAEIPRLASVALESPGVYDVQGPSVSSVAPAIFGDGSLTFGELVAGFRVYTSSQSPTSLRRSDGWAAASGVLPLGQTSTVPIPCPGSGTLYISEALVFDGGFETSYVASGPIEVICNRCPPDTQDKDGDGWLDRYGDPECCPVPEACDCDDSNPNVHPGAAETCDGLDDDCDGTVDDVAGLTVGKGAGVATLDWSAMTGSSGYDVERGDLGTLASSAGDFSASTQACVASGIVTTHAEDASALPAGQGTWYLVRAQGCAGAGTYDDSQASRVAPRDPGIAASGGACP